LTTLEVKKDAIDNLRETYLKFDLSGVGAVTGAKLRLYGKLSDVVAAGINVGIYDAADSTWNETALTYATKPSATTSVSTFNVLGTALKWYEIDLTSYLQAKKSAGATQATLVLKSLATGALVTFNSRNATSNQPQLVVTSGSVITPQAIVLSSSTLTVPEGSSKSFGVKLAAAPSSDVVVNIVRSSGDADLSASVATLTFTSSNWNVEQQVNISAAEDADTTNGSAVFTLSSSGLPSQTLTATEADNDVPVTNVTLSPIDDAFVRGGVNSSKNYNTGVLEVKKDGTDNTRETYLKFDLSSLGTITSAKLRLNGKLSNTVTGGMNLAVYDSTSTSWAEGTLTYATKPSTTTTAITSFNMTNTTSSWIELDLTSYLQAQKLAGKTQVTLAIKAITQAGALVTFNSAEATSNGPQLVVS
jgi:hypothetical protein